MKKIIALLLAAVMLLSLVSCTGGTPSAGGQPDQSSQSPAEESAPSGESTLPAETESLGGLGTGGNYPLFSGVYTVGEHITADTYLIRCTKTNYQLKIVVFESAENYDRYVAADSTTNGEENAAIEQNALFDLYISEGETYYIGLQNGFVMLVDRGEGELEPIDLSKTDIERPEFWYNGNPFALCTGVLFVGRDISAGQYKLSCEEADWSMNVVVFANAEDYFSYHKTSRFTNGEEADAIEQYALSSAYVSQGESSFIDLKADYVLMIVDGSGSLEPINGGIPDQDTDNSAVFPALCGVYFVGNDLDAGSYFLTCSDTDWGLETLVFETKEDYIAYHQTGRFTNGEESAAIEQNALSDFHLGSDESCYLNLREGMVLVLSDGTGVMTSANTVWAVDGSGAH